MGLSESKVVADTFSRACLNARNSGRINVSNLLSDKKVRFSYGGSPDKLISDSS